MTTDGTPLQTETISVSSLILDPVNARKHGAKNLEAIKGSLAKFGQQKPIVVGANNVVLAGNGTLAAARELGWETVSITRSALTGAEAMAFSLADNRTAELAEWDLEILGDTLEALGAEDFDLGAIGFDEEFIAALDPDEPAAPTGGDPPQDDGRDDVVPDSAPERAKDGDTFDLDGSTLHVGDCLATLRRLESASVDSLVTDPPAGISFMGKEWDDDKGGRDGWIKWLTEVMAECLRVLKPGGHGLVWALPRTSHWTATALEDAGFEVRDVIQHLFGSGFPKSLDISKAIDKAAGAEREVVERRTDGVGNTSKSIHKKEGFASAREAEYDVTAPSTDAAKQWQGWGTSLKPSNEHWILVRKPCSEKTVAANVLKHGTGGINVDGARVAGHNPSLDIRKNARKTGRAPTNPGKYSDEKWINRTSFETFSAERPSEKLGRFPANLILSHNHDCEQVGVKKVGGGERKDNVARVRNNGLGLGTEDRRSAAANSPDSYGTETVPAWRCTEGCPVAELDRQSLAGGMHSAGKARGGGQATQTNDGSLFGVGNHAGNGVRIGDTGGASRFFYCAKAAASDKGSSNVHPTVKSTALMSYLIKLVTPSGALLLDPFLGSGTTLIAATKLGMRCVGCEKETKYADIILSRWETCTGKVAAKAP